MKHACKKCRFLTTAQECPVCKGNQFTDSWKGKVVVFDVEKSEIAKRMGIKQKGEYCVKLG